MTNDDQEIHAENAIAAQEADQWDTYNELFDPILQACVKHGKPIGEARMVALASLGAIVGVMPPKNFGLPGEETDLF